MSCHSVGIIIATNILLVLLAPWFAESHTPHDTIAAMATSVDNSVIYAYTRNLLERSADNGLTWTPIRSFAAFDRAYLALSPYDGSIYINDNGVMYRSNDLIQWEQLPIQACIRVYKKTTKRCTAFTPDGVLIASRGRIFKETNDKPGVFEGIGNSNFKDYCPALAAVPGTRIVYAGTPNGIMKSFDGGSTWSLIMRMENIVDIKAQSGEVFIMLTTYICRLNAAETFCNNVNLPAVTSKERVRNFEPSPPTDITYTNDGTLIVLRANSYAIYETKDFGKNWDILSKGDSFITLGHGGFDAWEFEGSEEFTHVEGNVLGTWRGIFARDPDQTNEYDSHWTYRDTMRKAITALSLTKGGGFFMAACTYIEGCYLGPPGNLQPISVDRAYYFAVTLSPAYEQDGLWFEDQNRGFLLRHEGTKTTQPFLPRVNEDDNSFFIKSIVLSDDFANDGSMFVAGHNMGVLKSTNKGKTFKRVYAWETSYDSSGDGGVTRVVLSPNFSKDGTMACLVDPNLDKDNWSILDDEIQYIIVSRDYGESWRRLVWTGQTFRDLVIVDGKDDPVVVTVDVNGVLWSHTSRLDGWYPFSRVNGVEFPDRPVGFALDGLAVSPDGKTLAAAWVEGGIMFGQFSDDHTIAKKNRLSARPLDDKIPVKFIRNPPVDDVFGIRTFTSHIIFSPDYASDNTIFAADMFSIFRSKNKGADWKKVASL